METIGEYWRHFRSADTREVLQQVVNLGLLLTSALVAYKVLSFAMCSDSPVVVVLSESMEPTIKRGDLLFLSNFKTPYSSGDIVVYSIPGRDIPIVHRILRLHEDEASAEEQLLTKGDHNFADDRQLYNKGRQWLTRELIVGKAFLRIPYAGMLTIWLNDYPAFKYLLLGGLSLFALLTD